MSSKVQLANMQAAVYFVFESFSQLKSRTRAAHRDRSASSWPDALRTPACYRTPTLDLLVRLGRVRAECGVVGAGIGAGRRQPVDGGPARRLAAGWRRGVPFVRARRTIYNTHETQALQFSILNHTVMPLAIFDPNRHTDET